MLVFPDDDLHDHCLNRLILLRCLASIPLRQTLIVRFGRRVLNGFALLVIAKGQSRPVGVTGLAQFQSLDVGLEGKLFRALLDLDLLWVLVFFQTVVDLRSPKQVLPYVCAFAALRFHIVVDRWFLLKLRVDLLLLNK